MISRNDVKRIVQEKVFVREDSGVRIASTGSNNYKKVSWIFDFRAVMFEPVMLDYFAETFWQTYGQQYPFQVGGTESAAISLVTAIVLKGTERGTPVHGFFIRKSRKRDGLMKMFEGGLTDEPIILVDDLINSGRSVFRPILALKEVGKTVTDVFTILALRDPGGYQFARDHAIAVRSIFLLKDFGMPLLDSQSLEVPRASFDVTWKFSSGDPSFNYVAEKSAPAIDDKRIYFGTDNGVFWALDQCTGEIAWHRKTGSHPKGIFSSPVVLNGIVYFGSYNGTVYALDAKTGEDIWRYEDADWVGSSPAISSKYGLLYIGLEFGLRGKKGGVVALSLTSGKPIWEDRTQEFTHGSPLYIKEEDTVVVGSNDGILYAYDAKTGERKWTFTSGGDIKSRPAYDSARRMVLFGSWDGNLYALHASDGTLVFKYETEAPIFSTPLINGDTVYIASLDKNLYAINLSEESPRWRFETQGRIFATPVIGGESLWIGSNDGRLYELNIENGALKSFFQAPERIVNAIAYNASTHTIFVPTVANELYSIKKNLA